VISQVPLSASCQTQDTEEVWLFKEKLGVAVPLEFLILLQIQAELFSWLW
jgi:hypothetical protein